MKLSKLQLPKNSVSSAGLAIIGAAMVLLISGIAVFVQEERERKSIDQQTDSTNKLISEVKRLSEENKQLNQENRNFTYCTAVLLARYTQDEQPIVIKDLNDCVLESFTNEDTRPVDSEGEVDTQPVQSSLQGVAPTTQQNTQTQPQPITRTPQAPLVPQIPATPQNPQNPQTETVIPPNNLLTIPNVLQLNTPCLNVLGAVKTCN